eukprot:gene11017-3087_t
MALNQINYIAAIACLLCLLPKSTLSAFPSTSWVSFAHLLLPSSEDNTITAASFVFNVPESPVNLYGLTSPGWYLALVSNDGQEIVRLAHAWGVDRPQFYIFQEHYHNSNHYWWQSLPGHVLPGDIVVGKVSLVQGGYNLTLFSNITGQSTLNFVPKLSTTAFSELYLVMEHYPLACDELPQSNVIFTDINIDVNRETVHLSADSWNITNPVDHICDIRLSTDATGKRFVFQW